MEKQIMNLMAVLGEILNSRSVTINPNWLEDTLKINPNDLTVNTVTPAMAHELFATIDLSVARSEMKREELFEEIKELSREQEAIKEKIAEAQIKERVLSDLQSELQTCLEEVQKEKEKLL